MRRSKLVLDGDEFHHHLDMDDYLQRSFVWLDNGYRGLCLDSEGVCWARIGRLDSLRPDWQRIVRLSHPEYLSEEVLTYLIIPNIHEISVELAEVDYGA